MRDAFHQAAVAEKHVGVVIDDRSAGTIERRGEMRFRERHADRVREPLAERPRGGLDAERNVALGMPGGSAAELAKFLELVESDLVAREIGDRIQEHRAVAVRQDESVAVVPMRIARIEAQVVVPKHLGDVGHSHRHSRVTGLGALDRVHRQHTNRVGEATTRRPGCRHTVSLKSHSDVSFGGWSVGVVPQERTRIVAYPAERTQPTPGAGLLCEPIPHARG